MLFCINMLQWHIKYTVYFSCDLWLSTVKSLCVKSDSVWWNHISCVGVYPYSKCYVYCRHLHCGYINSTLKMSNDYSEWVFSSVLIQRIVKAMTFRIDLGWTGETMRSRLDQCSTPTLVRMLG